MSVESINTEGDFFYLKSDEDHYDLEDLFQGEYDRNRREWKFPESVRDSLMQFLNCSSSESESTDEEKPSEKSGSPKPKRTRDRLHRANSFNASDDSDEDDLDSLDGEYRRHRPGKRKLTKELSAIRKSIS
jgi:hypothetical protein